MLLQISALHKAFLVSRVSQWVPALPLAPDLACSESTPTCPACPSCLPACLPPPQALSDAFLEEQGQRQAEREDAAADLAALRRDLSARLRVRSSGCKPAGAAAVPVLHLWLPLLCQELRAS